MVLFRVLQAPCGTWEMSPSGAGIEGQGCNHFTWSPSSCGTDPQGTRKKKRSLLCIKDARPTGPNHAGSPLGAGHVLLFPLLGAL